LIGRINFIRRFISNLSGKIRAFSPLLKLKADQEFVWGIEQQLALDEIKNYLVNPPVLIPPQQGKPFRLYLSIDGMVIGSALIQEFEGKEHVIYYLSRRLVDAETRIGKWILALSEFDLRYESAKAVKGQIMADFVTQHCSVVETLDGSTCDRGGRSRHSVNFPSRKEI